MLFARINGGSDLIDKFQHSKPCCWFRQLDESQPETSSNLLNYLKKLGPSHLDLFLEYLPHLLPKHWDSVREVRGFIPY